MLNYGDIDYINKLINHMSIDKNGVERDLPLKIKMKLLKSSSAIAEDVKIIDKLKQNLYTKYGKPKDENQIEVPEENREEFLSKWDEVMREESKAEPNLSFKEDEFLDICDKHGIGLTFKDLQFCQDKIFEK